MGADSEGMPGNGFRKTGNGKRPLFLCSLERSLRETRQLMTIRGDSGIFEIMKDVNRVFGQLRCSRFFCRFQGHSSRPFSVSADVDQVGLAEDDGEVIGSAKRMAVPGLALRVPFPDGRAIRNILYELFGSCEMLLCLRQ